MKGTRRHLYLDAKSVRRCYKESCKALSTDYLDMFMLHDGTWDYKKRYRELVELYKSGCVRSIGVCNVNIPILEDMIKDTGTAPHLVQCQMHPLYTKKRLLSFCRENKIAFEAHSQFALNDKRLFENQSLMRLAEKYGKSIRQLILKWLVQQEIVVIPRSKRKENIQSNIDLWDFELTPDEIEEIDALNEDYSVKEYDVPSNLV